MSTILGEKTTSPTKVSYTQLVTWWNCQQRWHYNYVQELVPRTKARALSTGEIGHELLDVYYQVLMQGVPPGHSEAIKMVTEFAIPDFEGFAAGNASEKWEAYNNALRAVLMYIREFSPVEDLDSKVLATEYEFEVPLETPNGLPFILWGYVDLVLLVNNRIFVIDHKTTGHNKFRSVKSIDMDNQLLTYGTALTLLGKQIHGFAINELKTYPYKKPQPINNLFRRTYVDRSAAEMRAALENTARTVEQILTFKGEPIKSLTHQCGSCPYMRLCQLQMKGIDTKGEIAVSFMKKESRSAKGTKTS